MSARCIPFTIVLFMLGVLSRSGPWSGRMGVPPRVEQTHICENITSHHTMYEVVTFLVTAHIPKESQRYCFHMCLSVCLSVHISGEYPAEVPATEGGYLYPSWPWGYPILPDKGLPPSFLMGWELHHLANGGYPSGQLGRVPPSD